MEQSLDIRIRIARYFYSNPEKIPVNFRPISDSEYERLVEQSPLRDYYRNTPSEFDNIEEIKDYLAELGVDTNEISPKPVNNSYQDLIKLFPMNTSMQTILEPKEFLDFAMKIGDNQDNIYVMSYKHDGWNISTYYVPESEEPVFSHTRGRDQGEYKDVTFLAKALLPKIKVDKPTKFIHELIIKKDKLDELREKYPGKNWVNARNSVSSFVANHIMPEDYDKIEFITFGMQTQHGSFNCKAVESLYEGKFITPVNATGASVQEVINDFGDMEEYYISTYSNKYECDGIVFEIYNKNLVLLHKCAVKIGVWGNETFESKIVRFELGESEKNFTIKAIIEPVEARNGNIISTVDLINLRNIDEYQLDVGSYVTFEYVSSQVVKFIQGGND